MANAEAARALADQKTRYVTETRQQANPHNRLRLTRRFFLAASAATVATSSALANTPFTSFAFTGTNRTRSRTTPDRVADIYNVLDFTGIDPTGATDSTAAINAGLAAASNNGIIFFPKGTYKTTSAILPPSGSSLIFIGEGNGSTIFGNFNGFIFDNLSSPYNPAGAPSAIKQLNISNGYSGNNFAVTANGTWAASGSPVTITMSGSNPGVAAGGALFSKDSRVSTNTVFIGMITSVSWPNITLSSAAIGSNAASGNPSNLNLNVVQCYAAGASWLQGATSITMSSTPPAGISGQYYVYDYEYFLSDPKYNGNLGVATWSGTTLTFTAGTGAVAPSVGSSDRLWLAPVAGGIRYSSVAGAIVENCFIQGFLGLTSSEDKIVANDPTLGGAEGFHIKVDTCTFSNPTGCQGVPGQVGIYLQNNSIATNCTISGLWCAIRLSGASTAVIGGQFEVNYFGVILGGDFTPSNGAASDVLLEGFSLESNLLGVYVMSAGNTTINAIGAQCNAVSPLAGLYISSMAGVVQSSNFGGNFGSGYGVYIADPGNNRSSLKFIAVTARNASTPSQSWRIPAQAWAASFDQCRDDTALTPISPVYTVANLPGISTNPGAVEGDEFNVSDSTSATWGASVTTGGSTNHVKLRYNGTNYTVMGK